MTLAILPNWLGDLIMVEPAVSALRARGSVTGVVSPGLAPLVRDAGLVDRVEIFDRRDEDSGPWGLWRAGRRLRAGHADTAWVFGPSLRAAALAAATGAGRRVGVGGAGRELLLTEVYRPTEPARSVHLVDTWRKLVGAVRGAECSWRVGPRGEEGLEQLRREHPQLAAPFVVIAASATYGVTKQWPEEYFAELARQLRARHGLEPIWVAGGSQVERARASRLLDLAGGVDLTGATDLPTLAAVLSRARLFVGNDSGPMHLAAALRRPTVGIFGSTSPAWTAPRGPRALVVGPAEVECSPCFAKRCPWDRECLRGIGVAEVLEQAEAALAPPAPVFWLDRDGTLADDPGYLKDPANLKLYPSVTPSVARLNQVGQVYLVTNQSGIGRGLMTRSDVDAVHARLRERLAADGARLDGIGICPHVPGVGCDCRKPAPGLIFRGRDVVGRPRGLEFMVGDKKADLGLARATGCIAVLVRTGEGAQTESELRATGELNRFADHVAEDFPAAVDWMLATIRAGERE